MPDENPSPTFLALPRQSAEIFQLMGALLAARRAFLPVTRRNTVLVTDEEKPRSYAYADLAAYIDAVTPALLEQGILLEQEVQATPGGRYYMRTLLIHAASQQWKASFLPMSSTVDSDPHASGSRITYARRHALALMLGLSTRDEDDDGATASATARADKKDRAARGGRSASKQAPEEPAPQPAPPEPQGLNEQIARIREDVKAAFAEGGRDAADLAWQKHARFILAQSDDLREIISDGYHAIVGDAPPVPEAGDAG